MNPTTTGPSSGITAPNIESAHGPAPARALAARRCYLTVLFCDLSDSTELGAALEAEHYADMLGNIRAACAEIIARHGGMIVRQQGDGMLAIFGYPVAREDDGRRATEAALDVHAHVREMRPHYLPDALAPLAVHSGIHSGLLLVEEGDIVLGRFELLGNVPNIASRLSGFAGRDEIVVSEESLGPQAHFFVTGARLSFHPKGSAEPLPVYQVSARATIPNRFEARALRGMAPFVGRHDELGQLQQHLRRAAAGAPQFAAVFGGPGMGKTRLVEEFLALAAQSGCQAHKGYCESYLSAEPLQPFLQMLRALFGLERGMAATEAAAVADGVLSAIDPLLAVHGDEFMRLLSLRAPGSGPRPVEGAAALALRDLFDILATKRPVLLFIDDWQWADDASRQALSAILNIRRPLFVLVATRADGDDELIKRQATAIALAPLAADETAQAIHKLLPSTDPFIAADIHRYSGGNPLFIEELCHSAAAEGDARRKEAGHRSAAWLNALIESRVERLPAELAQVVRIAAVIGNVVPTWLLAQLTGRDEQDPQVAALAEQDFVFPTDQSGVLRFKHGITRDVIYNAVGLHERRSMHLRVARAIESERSQGSLDDGYEALAYHCGAGGDAPNAARYAELAGDKAMAASALDRARGHYGAALAALDEVGKRQHEALQRWIVVLQKLGLACVFDPLGVQDSVALFTKGLALAHEFGDPEQVARAEYWLGYVCYSKGRALEAKRHCELALAQATELGDERLAAQVRATLGQVLTSACDYGPALPLLESAVEAKRRSAKGGRRHVAVGSAYSLSCKGLILGDRGLFDQAHDCFAQALDLIVGADHQVESSVRGWMCTVHQWQGRWEDGLREADEAVRIGAHVKSSHLLAISRSLWGYCRWMHTGQADALQVIEDSTAWMEQRGGRLFSSLNNGWLVDGFITLGRHEQARRHAARVLVRARQLDRIGEALACRALARAAGQAGDGAGAERFLALARRSAEARGSAHEHAANALCRAQIAAQRGHRDDARRALEAASPAFEHMQMRWHQGLADALWRELG